MAVNLSPLAGAGWQFFDNSGVILSGGLLYTYAAGTTTPQVTYTSSSGSTPNSNPIILDSAGRTSSEVWLTSGVAYKFILKTSTGITLWTYDNVSGINDFGTNLVGIQSINGGQLAGLRNRIINGDMRIDQRNGGAAITPTGSTYTLDRWQLAISQASKLTVRQNLNTIAPPEGFGYQFGISTAVAVPSLAAGDYFSLNQNIEGYNVQDFAFGSASASKITLSFWARSSLTGTFSGGLGNNANNRSYVFTYSIPTANTWTKISVTIAGDTGGTWTADNTTGLVVRFSLGMGSTFSSTAGSWQTGSYYASTGSVSVVGTLSANFYITGVQLELGPVATTFEQRPYGLELMLCQRYFQLLLNGGIGVSFTSVLLGRVTWPLSVVMRAGPTLAVFSGTPTFFQGSTATYSSFSTTYITTTTVQADLNISGGTATVGIASIQKAESGVFSASAEL